MTKDVIRDVSKYEEIESSEQAHPKTTAAPETVQLMSLDLMHSGLANHLRNLAIEFPGDVAEAATMFDRDMVRTSFKFRTTEESKADEDGTEQTSTDDTIPHEHLIYKSFGCYHLVKNPMLNFEWPIPGQASDKEMSGRVSRPRPNIVDVQESIRADERRKQEEARSEDVSDNEASDGSDDT